MGWIDTKISTSALIRADVVLKNSKKQNKIVDFTCNYFQNVVKYRSIKYSYLFLSFWNNTIP